MSDYLIDAADLLAEPDPGPTPWLVDELIVDQALTAVVGRWKTTKSWGMLEVAVSIATGTPAFGVAAIPEPGPVIYVIEESGRRALWRRLDMLCRGRAIRPDQLRERLLLGPNLRVKLDDPDWQARLLDTGLTVRPRAFIFDPLVRMKAPDREESGQSDMAHVVEYLRQLRDETEAASLFVHHTGHQGDHMRGTSDLESVWESRLTFKRDGDNGIVTVTAAHREEEDGGLVAYRLDHDRETRTIRLRQTVPPLEERIVDHLREHGPTGAAELAKALEIRRSRVDQALISLSEAGTTCRGPSGKRDASGRPAVNKVWQLSDHAGLQLVPPHGRPGTSHPSAGAVRPGRPPSLEGDDRTTRQTGATDTAGALP